MQSNLVDDGSPETMFYKEPRYFDFKCIFIIKIVDWRWTMQEQIKISLESGISCIHIIGGIYKNLLIVLLIKSGPTN